MLKMAGRRKDHIRVCSRIGHGHIRNHGEDVLSRQTLPHRVLIRMHDQGIMVVDKNTAQWRFDIVLS